MKIPFRPATLVFPLAMMLGGGGCRRPAPVDAKPPASPPRATPSAGSAGAAASPRPELPEFAVDAVAVREGTAVWYDVPDQSLPERRAWAGELTGASDAVPLDTYVRVRRIDQADQGKSVVVRVTDRVHGSDALIDLCREAAETLGMVRKGTARVRMETLALKNADARKSVDKKDESPTVEKVTTTPAATEEQEKKAAADKAGGTKP